MPPLDPAQQAHLTEHGPHRMRKVGSQLVGRPCQAAGALLHEVVAREITDHE